MKYPQERRKTHVMMFGMSRGTWLDWKTMAKGGLQSFHMGWTFTSGYATTAEEAVRHIQEREDLELVCFRYESLPIPGQALRDASAIAEALGKHPHKPWVVFGDDLDYLKPVFERAGITVSQEWFEFAVFNRWKSQLEPACIE